MRQHHYYVEPRAARGTKLALEARGVRPRFAREGGLLSVLFAGDADTRLGGACEGCALCSGGPEPALKPPVRRYVLYPPLALLPTGSTISESAAQDLAAFLGCTHVAINGTIKDTIRQPQIVPVLGAFGLFDPDGCDFDGAFWCTCTQNGIYQTWAPLYTMFSRGNITEKARVLHDVPKQHPVAGTTVIDLYAGIGYFAFSYMANRPRRVYCWEINPWSVEALVRGAGKNGWPVRVVRKGEPYVARDDDGLVVFHEDNRCALDRLGDLDLLDVSHINMGLIPDCRASWPVARALAGSWTVYHVHENVNVEDIAAWSTELEEHFGTCLHVEKIKSFSPGTVHVCGDFGPSISENDL